MEYEICKASTAKKIGLFLSMYLQEITDEMNKEQSDKPTPEKEVSTASSLAKDMLKKNHTKKQTLSSSSTRSVSSEEEEEYASDSDDNSESSEEKIIIVKKTDYAIKLPGQLSSQSATRIQSNSFQKDINGLTTKSQGKSIKQRYVQNLVNDRPHNKLGYDEPDFVIGSTYKTKSSSNGSVVTANSKYSKGSSNGSHASNSSALNKHINRGGNKLDNSTSSRVTSSTATSNKTSDTSSSGMRYDEMKSIMKSIMRDKTLSKKEMVIKMEEVKAMYSALKAKESAVPKSSVDGVEESINGTDSNGRVLANSQNEQRNNDTTNNLRNSATSSGEYSWKSNGNQDEVDTSSYTPPQSQTTSSTVNSSSVTTSDDTINDKEQEEVVVDTDKMKRKEMKAIMKDKTLSKKEMVMRMEAIKAKYDGMTMGEPGVSEEAHVHSVGGDVYLRGNSMGSAVSSLAPSVAPSITVSSTQDEVNDRNTMSFDEQRRAALQSIMRDKSLTKEERRVKLEEVKQKFSVEASTSTSTIQSSARDDSQYASQTDGRRQSSILPGQLSAAAAAEKHRKEIENLKTSKASSVRARYQENLIKDRPHNKLGVAEPQALLEDKKTKSIQASSSSITKTIMPVTAKMAPPPQTQELLEEQRRAELQSIMRDKTLTKEERRLKIEEVKAKYAAPPSKRFLAEMDLSAQSYADRPKQEIEEMKETVIPVSERIAAVNKNVDDDIMKGRRRRSEIAVKDKGRDSAYSKARTQTAANVDPTAFGVMYHRMYGVQRDKKSKARSEYAGRF